MVFNSLTFIVFLFVVLVLHRLPFNWKLKKANLVAASYLFYAAWSPPFVLLLWLSTIIDWSLSLAIGRARHERWRKVLLMVSLTTNLGMLGWFKYGEFLLENWIALMDSFGIQFHPLAPDIILPVGISFYTFQTLSYTIDVYRRAIPPTRSLLDFTLFVSFFPQLVAGPIVRPQEFLPQCGREHVPNASEFGWGATLLVTGLFMKVIVADASLALIVDRVYGAVFKATPFDAWLGTLAFAGQIFCDFAGYTTCAIGVAMMLGFALPVNFRYPYAAIGFSDFWRRWHISLSTWLRDYLYVPLGGNRDGVLRTYRNLMLTMLLGGLWHGASWQFVIWGGLHGIYLMVERLLRRCFNDLTWSSRWYAQAVAMLVTFALVCIAWVYFRSASVSQANRLVSAMFGREGGAGVLNRADAIVVLVIMTVLLGWHLFMRERSLEEIASRLWWPLRAAAIASMLFFLALAPGEDRAFIYFQF